MTCYVDPIKTYLNVKKPAQKWGIHWCHLICDTTEELDAMAHKIGLSSSYKQQPGKGFEHHDLVPSKRNLAVMFGAVEKSLREILIAKGLV